MARGGLPESRRRVPRVPGWTQEELGLELTLSSIRLQTGLPQEGLWEDAWDMPGAGAIIFLHFLFHAAGG